MQKATVFDKIAASSPLDATAGRVTARGEHWVPENPLPPGMMHWKAPPLVKAFGCDPQDNTDQDLTGKTFGRFRVIGVLADEGGTNRGRRWVCKCLCGDYEARSGKAIRLALSGLSPATGLGFRCFYCAQWEVAKNRYKKHGSKALSTFTAPKIKIVEAKKPEDIVADVVGALTKCDDCEKTGILIIAALNRAGYRVTREKIATLVTPIVED